MVAFLQDHVWLIAVALVGACVGSFLNVVIYRAPRGLSVNEPKRSFCPGCEKEISWFRNVPLVTWVVQRGRCAGCEMRIPFRYWLVEVLTMGLFVGAFLVFENPWAAALVMVMMVALVVSFFIDLEHMLIPVRTVAVAGLFGLVGGWFVPEVSNLGGMVFWPTSLGEEGARWMPVVGGLVGFGSLWLMVLLGKLLFGKRRMVFEKAESWALREPKSDEEELAFVVGDEVLGWGELFYRPTDRLIIQSHGVKVDGRRERVKEVVVMGEAVFLDGKKRSIESLKSLSGRADEVVIPREAMGGGDPPLLGMIGCFLGWPGVLFTVLASCFLAIGAALVGRIGLGRPLPFGPFLVLGALIWVFGGWRIWEMYVDFLGLRG